MTHAIRRILVLCEGNHCRSPLAEALLRQALGASISVHSAGLGALVGEPAHLEVQRLGMGLGVNLGTHRGRQFRPAQAKEADLILVMDQAQKEACEAIVPAARGRVFLLGHWLTERKEITDPIHRDAAAHLGVCEHIQDAIQAWLPRLRKRTS